MNINFSGFLTDIVVRKKILTITNARKFFSILGNLLPAIFIIALAFVTCQIKYIAVILLTIGITFVYVLLFFLSFDYIKFI